MSRTPPPTSQPLEYETAKPLVSVKRVSVLFGIVHLLASILLTWLWMNQSHDHMLHGNLPYSVFEMMVRAITRLLHFPTIIFWEWCVRVLPDLGQPTYIAAIVLVFVGNSALWAGAFYFVLRRVQRRSTMR